MHQTGLQVVLEAIRELCSSSSAPYKFANGEVFVEEARQAFFMGDQPAQGMHVAKKSKSCRICAAPRDCLDDTETTWPVNDWRECYLSLLHTAATFLDDEGNVIQSDTLPEESDKKLEEDVWNALCAQQRV